MSHSSCTRTARSVLLAMSLSLAAAVAFAPSGLVGAPSKSELLVLSNLPPRSSAQYQALRKLAGAGETRDLEMTGSQAWRVPRAHYEEFLQAAAKSGVTVRTPGANWNRALAPMQGEHAMSARQKELMHRTMGSKAAMGMSMMELPPADVMEFAMTGGMGDASAGAPSTLEIPLKDDMTVTARRTSVTKSGDGYVWRGKIEGSDQPVTLIWHPTGHMAGTISYGGHMYVVKDLGEGMHGVVEYDPDSMPPDHGPASKSMMRKMNMRTDPLVHQGDASMMTAHPEPGRAMREASNDKQGPAQPATISLIVAYTKAAADAYADIERDLIALAVEEANQSFRDSGIDDVRLEVAHAYQTDYAESGTHFDHVYRFRNKGDGYMDEIHDLRNLYGADVAVLLVDDPMGCGLSIRVAADEKDAFTALHHECAATMQSLAHEIGHLIGARHDRALDDTPRPFAYGHGYVHADKWRTIMSYKDSCGGCERRSVWSSPDVLVDGVAAGDESTDNARVIRDQAKRVADFRSPPSHSSRGQ